jgi:polyisoprenoid-binding protein YceI
MSKQRWEIDSAHSGIHFSVRHLVIAKVRGQFARWSGFIEREDGDPARSTVNVTIDASSIQTGVEDRDAHLKSADFFDVAKYPEIRFVSTSVEGEGQELRMKGELTMHGVTREVTLDVEDSGRTNDPWGNTRAAFSAKTTVDRKDFGLTWNQLLETGGVAVGEKVTIELEVEAVKQAAAKVA